MNELQWYPIQICFIIQFTLQRSLFDLQSERNVWPFNEFQAKILLLHKETLL